MVFIAFIILAYYAFKYLNSKSSWIIGGLILIYVGIFIIKYLWIISIIGSIGILLMVLFHHFDKDGHFHKHIRKNKPEEQKNEHISLSEEDIQNFFK